MNYIYTSIIYKTVKLLTFIVIFCALPISPITDQQVLKAIPPLNQHSIANINPSRNSQENGDNYCPTTLECSRLAATCIDCPINPSCVYGEDVNVTCKPKKSVSCVGQTEFIRSINCRYCYQTKESDHNCVESSQCKVVSSPRQRYLTNCTVNANVVCMGSRKFQKNILCNWTAGYKWTTALLLSICLGGFGADRFYLGHWQEGIGKLFSFGGLGVWTLVDVILVATGYLGPADKSLYLF